MDYQLLKENRLHLTISISHFSEKERPSNYGEAFFCVGFKQALLP